MERFVRLIVAGGVALVVGLWIAELATTASRPWLAGVTLAVVGAIALLAGTVSELEF